MGMGVPLKKKEFLFASLRGVTDHEEKLEEI
jgi:hypothetical protein